MTQLQKNENKTKKEKKYTKEVVFTKFQKLETEIFAFWVITFEPIKI